MPLPLLVLLALALQQPQLASEAADQESLVDAQALSLDVATQDNQDVDNRDKAASDAHEAASDAHEAAYPGAQRLAMGLPPGNATYHLRVPHEVARGLALRHQCCWRNQRQPLQSLLQQCLHLHPLCLF